MIEKLIAIDTQDKLDLYNTTPAAASRARIGDSVIIRKPSRGSPVGRDDELLGVELDD